MKNILKNSLYFIVLNLSASYLYAHGSDEKRSSISASTHLFFSNKSAVAPNQTWQVPGTLMGGEAYPVEKGLNLQDIELQGTWMIQPEYSANAKIASHHNGEVEIENLWFSFYPKDTLTFSIGKIDANFSPNATWHAYTSHFSEAPLSSQVLFGGHFSDQGIQSIYKNHSFTLGAEAWNGNTWPASPGEYSADIFVHYKKDFDALKLSGGIWSLYSEALNRSDTRYASGHTHGNSTVVAAPSIFFSGINLLNGAFLELEYAMAHHQTLGWSTEIIQQTIDGTIADATRASEMNSEHYALINQIYFDINKLSFAIRHEMMSFDNEFKGASANFIASDANLMNDDFEPSRTHLSISKYIDSFTLRAEAIADKSISKDALNRFSLSLVWQDTLWRQSH